MKTNNYDSIAGSYDFLSRLVFSRAQVQAQVDLLKYIPAGASILVVGGGTGWILEEIAKIHTSGLKIVYVEISSNMLERAKKRVCGSNEIEFVHSDIEHYRFTQVFDLIHTAFLFDNFEQNRAASVFQLLFNNLKVSGLWLYTDFKIETGRGSVWKSVMLRLMYVIFRTIAHVEARKLPSMEAIFDSNGCAIIGYQQYYSGFIESIIFKKSQKLPTFIENLKS